MLASICVCVGCKPVDSWSQTQKIQGCRVQFILCCSPSQSLRLSCPSLWLGAKLGQMKWHVLLCNENRAVLILACGVCVSVGCRGSCVRWVSSDAALCSVRHHLDVSTCDVIRKQFAPWQTNPRKTPALLKQNKLLHLVPKTQNRTV